MSTVGRCLFFFWGGGGGGGASGIFLVGMAMCPLAAGPHYESSLVHMLVRRLISGVNTLNEYSPVVKSNSSVGQSCVGQSCVGAVVVSEPNPRTHSGSETRAVDKQ